MLRVYERLYNDAGEFVKELQYIIKYYETIKTIGTYNLSLKIKLNKTHLKN